MAFDYLSSPITLYVPGANSLPDAPSPVISCFFALFAVLFYCCYCLFGTLCGCCFWGIHSNSPPPNYFVCATDLLHTRSTANGLPFAASLFSRPHHDELPTPLSTSVFGLHAIGSLLVAVIRIVCVCVFFFFFFQYC